MKHFHWNTLFHQLLSAFLWPIGDCLFAETESHFATLRYRNIENGFVVLAREVLNLVNDEEGLLVKNASKHDVLPVQVGRRRTRDKELIITWTSKDHLTTICIRSRIGLPMNLLLHHYHCQQTRPIERDIKTLVIKMVSVDAKTSRSISLDVSSISSQTFMKSPPWIMNPLITLFICLITKHLPMELGFLVSHGQSGNKELSCT